MTGHDDQALDSLGLLSTQLGVMQKRNRWLLGIALALAVALVVVGIYLYTSYVLPYAVLVNVRMEQSSQVPHEIRFSYDVTVPGVVEFWHGDARLMSHVGLNKGPEHQFSWRWHNRGTVAMRVRYRRWLLPAWETKEFQM